MKWTSGGNAKPRQFPVAGGQKSPVAVSPAGATLGGSHQAHGWTRVPGTARPWSAGFQGDASLWAGFHKAERLCVRGQGADSPLAGQRPAVKAGILRDGFGVPLARNIACDV
jgi:hypothetical protein